MIRIVEANFIKSAPDIDEAISEDCMEVAFLGRSNVGKSSLINALTNHKNLAKSSSTPGKTQLINFFRIVYQDDDKNKYLARFVDLPGFGYAKVSKDKKAQWQIALNDFIKERVSIRVFVHLIDSRHLGLDIDRGVADYLQTIRRPDQKILTIYTKADKLNKSEANKLTQGDSSAILVSVLKKQGLQKANDTIFNTLF